MALGFDVVVKRAHETSLADLRSRVPQKIVISPGPGKPTDHPFIFEVLKNFAGEIPLLGICLGMQAMNEYFGGTIRKDPIPKHGKTSEVAHASSVLFRGVPSPFVAARYHSLRLDRVAFDLRLTAWTDDQVPMGVEHVTLPIFAVQFHPESFLTPDGKQILKNFYAFTQD